MPSLRFDRKSVRDLRWNLVLERGQVIDLLSISPVVATPGGVYLTPLWVCERDDYFLANDASGILGSIITDHRDLEFRITVAHMGWTREEIRGGPLLTHVEGFARPVEIPRNSRLRIVVGSHAQEVIRAVVNLRLHLSTPVPN